jgi:hypothetical protein
MADVDADDGAERERIREHYRAVLAHVAEISPETRDAEVRVVRAVAAARRRSVA